MRNRALLRACHKLNCAWWTGRHVLGELRAGRGALDAGAHAVMKCAPKFTPPAAMCQAGHLRRAAAGWLSGWQPRSGGITRLKSRLISTATVAQSAPLTRNVRGTEVYKDHRDAGGSLRNTRR
jgi:hypothetical protein